jgi:hypothetical protein
MKTAPGVRLVNMEETLFACKMFAVRSYREVLDRLSGIRASVPGDMITGPSMLVRHYVSSVTEGSLVELGFPVSRSFFDSRISTRTLPAVQCLSVESGCPAAELGGAYEFLFGYAYQKGLISDEYGIEIIHRGTSHDECLVEARLVLHPWENLFRRNLRESLGEEEAGRITRGWNCISPFTDIETRFQSVKKAMENLTEAAGDETVYDCVSKCAHVFPGMQIAKLRNVFDEARESGDTVLQAVDRVIEFMGRDPGWGETPVREGNVILTSKGPRDPSAAENAATPEERAEAACFCPIIRKKLAEGMPRAFCYCGAGWYRQQWEGATGLPVRVEIVESLISGDQRCSFAVHLPLEPS